MARIDDGKTSTTVVTGERRSSGSLWFIVGALVVAVAIIAYLFLGDAEVATAPEAGGGDVNVTVDAPDAPAVEAPAADAPVAETPAPAPAN